MAGIIEVDRNSRKFYKDLQTACSKYCEKAIQMGATEAVTATSGVIVVDPRVQMRCHSPRCPNFGKCANCPPHFQPPIEWCRSVINSYRTAVVFRIKFEAELVCKNRTEEQKKQMSEITKQANNIVAEIESSAFYDGYYLSFGVGAGSCKAHLCPDQPCQALSTGICRHPLKARAAGEGLGIDYFITAARLGWDVYSIGASTAPGDVPHGSRIGIVLID